MNCNRCLFDSSIAKIESDGMCEYCHLHDTLEAQSSGSFAPVLDKIRRHRGKYNCLIGISGGLDSSTLLYMAVREWGLRPLVIHFDNWWNSEAAESNMRGLLRELPVDSITYRVNKIEYDMLNQAFLEAGVPDADIPNDIAMTKLMYQTASKYGIKWILNGHDFRTEGSTPKGWTYMDAKYIRSVYKEQMGLTLENYPLLTFWDQIKYAVMGIKQARPFHYKEIHARRKGYEHLMKELIGWKDYGAKHAENLYTEFVGAGLLPDKFGIDKRIVYLSAQVRSGAISREDALMRMSSRTPFDYKRMPVSVQIGKASPVGDRQDYDRYNFRKYRWLIWLLARLKVVPYTFYKKYAR